MVRRSGWVVLFFALVPGLTAVFGQAAVQSAPQTSQAVATADPVMPKDPNAAMQLAARVNRLASVYMKPWHLKANYQTFDADGKPKDQGVFEEWWAGPEKYKISYTSKSFNQVQYRNGEKTLMTGDVKWPPILEGMVEQFLVHPLPAEEAVDKEQYEAADHLQVVNIKINCIEARSLPESPIPVDFCFDKKIPALRIEFPSGGLVVLFNDIARVDGQYVARAIQIGRLQKPVLEINLATIEYLPIVNKAIFAVPETAVAPVEPLNLRNDVLAGFRISGDGPKYPPIARAAHVEGTVVLDVVINTSGEIDSARVVSGPPMLQQAAIDGVKTWKYKPYLLDGRAVAVKTQMNIVFGLGR